jgi:hypothetical protein
LAKLQGQSLCEFITPFVIRSVNEKNFMIMPHYASTLESHPGLDDLLGIQQMSQAIMFLQNLAYGHQAI